MFGSLVSGVLGTGLGVYQAIQGSQDKKRAERELNDYERQTLNNAYDKIQISTVGSDLMTQESQRTAANLVDATRQSGLRGVLGGIPKIQAQNNLANQEARKYLDDQVNKRQYSIAEDDIRIRGIKENRDIANISALSSQVDAGKQDMWSGIIGGFKGISMLGNAVSPMMDKKLGLDKYGKEDKIDINANNMISPTASMYGPNNYSAPPILANNSYYDNNSSILNNYSIPQPPKLDVIDYFQSSNNVNTKNHFE